MLIFVSCVVIMYGFTVSVSFQINFFPENSVPMVFDECYAIVCDAGITFKHHCTTVSVFAVFIIKTSPVSMNYVS